MFGMLAIIKLKVPHSMGMNKKSTEVKIRKKV
jgi:hypothetical protein